MSESKNWKDIASEVGQVKMTEEEKKQVIKDEREAEKRSEKSSDEEAARAAARVRMTHGVDAETRVESVPLDEVSQRRKDGWVIAPE